MRNTNKTIDSGELPGLWLVPVYSAPNFWILKLGHFAIMDNTVPIYGRLKGTSCLEDAHDLTFGGKVGLGIEVSLPSMHEALGSIPSTGRK